MKFRIGRAAVIAIAAPAFALAVPGMAMADTFGSSDSHAGPKGAYSAQVVAHSGGHGGGATYVDSMEWAGPHGAGSSTTFSHADGFDKHD